MKKIYYYYRYQTDREGCRYTPYHKLQAAYPEWGDKVRFVDEEFINTSNSGKQLGYAEVDDSIYNEVLQELTDFGLAVWLKVMVNGELGEHVVKNIRGYKLNIESGEVEKDGSFDDPMPTLIDDTGDFPFMGMTDPGRPNTNSGVLGPDTKGGFISL